MHTTLRVIDAAYRAAATPAEWFDATKKMTTRRRRLGNSADHPRALDES